MGWQCHEGKTSIPCREVMPVLIQILITSRDNRTLMVIP